MRHSRSAFTLIELLVVIAIVAVLITLIFSMTKGAIARANQTKSLNNMRQIGSGLLLYAADHDGQFPPRQMDGDNQDRWPKLLASYLGDTKVFAAPDDPTNFQLKKSDPLSNSENNTSYVVNGGWDPGLSQDQVFNRPLRLASVEQPSKTVLVTAAFNNTNFYLDVQNGDTRSVLDTKLFDNKSNSYVFMDGSARTIDYKEYEKLNEDGGSADYIWLINKDAQ